MRRRKATLRATLALLAVGLLAAAAASPAAAAAPAWTLTVTPMPANFRPGAVSQYLVVATNVGGAPTTGTPSVVEADLPSGLVPISAQGFNTDPSASSVPVCSIAPPPVTCKTSEAVGSGFVLRATIRVEVPPATPEETLETQATVSGGGAGQAVSATARTPIQSSPVPFGFFGGIRAPLSADDGSAASLAGSHPYQQTLDFGFPTESPGGVLTGSGHPHDVLFELPRGLIGNPAASPVLCTEAELTSDNTPGCPEPSQIGMLGLTTVLGDVGNPVVLPSAVYNMVPPPGTPAEIAINVGAAGYYIHLQASLRSDGDYGIDVALHDAIAPINAIFAVQTQVWGDPTGAVHDGIRGECRAEVNSCPVTRQETPFWTMPGDCPGTPIATEAQVDSWEEPGLFHRAAYESADLEGNPVTVDGCNGLEFEPRITSQPTTSLADSPSGLDFDLHQPQNMELGHRATAELKDALVTLPAGMSVNPSQADGLGACSEGEIGFEAQKAGVHFSKTPNTCPDAAKLGTVEVTSPLLVRRKDEGTKLATDPETGDPIPEPLHGSVYLAKPLENPFGSLIAVYLAVEDPKTGIVAKLAGRVEPDPQSGQLSTRFAGNPELPIEDVRLHLFDGARGALITPQSCGAHTTSATLTPWSTPEGIDAHPSDSFQTTTEPGGGNCPSSDAAAANHPSFSAGTISPQAAAFSPFLLKLSREDGSQRLAGIDATLAPGLTGKLAGIAHCSDAQLAAASARSHPNEGILERQSPSCPASSRVGSVDVAAGAGPIPFHTQGTAYLAGPYKGAPLSVAIVTPAIAGPFDLGAVVVRTALYVNPDTAQIHAVSDPLPQILDGIPLDVRSIALRMDRPDFTLNPTSCDPMTIAAASISTLGQSAALSSPFQVGGCSQLPFKPKLSLKLKGGTKRAGHPKLIATLKAKPGEANIASAQVKLPPSAFLDQAHIRTICTRVQFAADACPKGSIYGAATAITPLLDQPLTGNVYLRSSSHKLPDLVVALKGPASLPIEIDLDGKTDSVKGALRNTFEAVPDAPVSSFRLELFGGKRGLVVNSRDLCAHAYKAEVNLHGQSGKVFDTEPAVGTDCGKRRKGKGRRRH